MSNKWVIVKDRKQNAIALSAEAPGLGPGASGSSVQDRYCARSLGSGAKRRRGDGKKLGEEGGSGSGKVGEAATGVGI